MKKTCLSLLTTVLLFTLALGSATASQTLADAVSQTLQTQYGTEAQSLPHTLLFYGDADFAATNLAENHIWINDEGLAQVYILSPKPLSRDELFEIADDSFSSAFGVSKEAIAKYHRLIGNASVSWENEEYTLYQVSFHVPSTSADESDTCLYVIEGNIYEDLETALEIATVNIIDPYEKAVFAQRWSPLIYTPIRNYGTRVDHYYLCLSYAHYLFPDETFLSQEEVETIAHNTIADTYQWSDALGTHYIASISLRATNSVILPSEIWSVQYTIIDRENRDYHKQTLPCIVTVWLHAHTGEVVRIEEGMGGQDPAVLYLL